jgi:hypothetical protein
VTVQEDQIPHGLPDHLPEDETLLWQGRPDWQRLAVNAFHVRKVAIYFAAIAVSQITWRLVNGETVQDAMRNLPYLILLALIACGILLGLAYASAKTTLYTLTSKRLLLKIGIALPAYINLPLKHIDAASVADTGKGCGTICFRTAGDTRLAYLLLWPHVRAWHITKPQPALRDIPNVEAVAGKLARVLGGQSVTSSAASHHADMVPAE